MSSGIKGRKRERMNFEVFLLFNSINEDKSCDILIIGGGIAGLLTAKELSDMEKEIIVAEKQSIGSERTSAGKDVVFTDGGISLEKQENVNIKKLNEEFTALTEELEKICDTVGERSFKKRGLLIFSDSPKGRHDMRRRFAIEKFTNKETDFLTSDSDLADFSFDFDSAVYTEFGGATLNAKQFSKRTASYLSLNGIFTAENTEIKTLVPSSDGFTAQTGTGAKITAKKVIDTRCRSEKRAVFCAKTAPTAVSHGWPQECIIRDTYKNRMTFFQTDTKNLAMTYEKNIILPQIFGTEHHFDYMQQIFSSMFFAIPDTVFKEKSITFDERVSTGQPGIVKSDEFPNLFIFKDPYRNGILSAIKGAKDFALTAKGGK